MSTSDKEPGDSASPIESRSVSDGSQDEGFDPGSRAVADALRLTFGVLKLIMVCIVVVFIWSGFYKVEESEVAIQLRFGAIRGTGEARVKKPRSLPYWKWPDPIDEVVKVPSSKVERYMNIDVFWNEDIAKHSNELLPSPYVPLRFAKDGYCLTASASATEQTVSGGKSSSSPTGADYNIAHSKWRLHYRISDPIQFMEKLWDGTDGTPPESNGWYPVEKLLRNVVSDAVIVTSAHWDIDDLLWDHREDYQDQVEWRIKSRLEALQVGINVNSLEYIEQAPPWQVKVSFDNAQSAFDTKQTLLNEAEGKREEILREAEAQSERVVQEAKSNSNRVEKEAESEAAYLEEVLGKIEALAQERAAGDESAYRKIYNKLLSITLDQLYQETLREVISKADEVFVVPSTKDHPTEIRMHLNRDVTLRPRNTEEEE